MKKEELPVGKVLDLVAPVVIEGVRIFDIVFKVARVRDRELQWDIAKVAHDGKATPVLKDGEVIRVLELPPHLDTPMGKVNLS